MDATWQLCFATITGFQYHPANPSDERLSLEECAKIADDMYKLTMERSCQ